MFSLEEMGTWTIAEVRGEIRKLLIPAWKLRESKVEGWFRAELTGPEGTLWEDSQADERILLLNLFGWLYLRNAQPKHPAWKARPATKRIRVGPTQGGPQANMGEPADLDPVEIDPLVYPKGDKEPS